MIRPTDKNFIPYANLIRAVAVMLVLLDHSLSYILPDFLTNLQKHIIFSGNASIFFMLTGALLLPMRHSTGKFLKYRFVKIGIPFILWSLLYLIINQKFTNQIGGGGFLYGLKMMAFKPSFAEGWYFYVLGALYLAIPIISPFIMLASKRRLQYYLVVWIAAATLPYLKYIGLWGFSATDNFLSTFYNYSGFLVLGYYLRKYPLSSEPLKISIPVVILSAVTLLLPAIIEQRCRMFGYRVIMEELGATTIAWCIIVFSILQQVGTRHTGLCNNAPVRWIVRISFVAYLSQNLFIKQIVLPFYTDGRITSMEAITLGISLCLLFSTVYSLTTPIVWKRFLRRLKQKEVRSLPGTPHAQY